MLSPFVEKVRLHERARFLDGREKSPPSCYAKRRGGPRNSAQGFKPLGSDGLKVLPAGSPARIRDENEKVTPGYSTAFIIWRHLRGRLITNPGSN
jgi:hypothetical protein